MRARRGGGGWRRGALHALLPALLAGCAGHRAFPPMPAPELLPPGSPLLSRTLAEPDAWLRHYLLNGEYPAALEALGGRSPIAPRDRLLRALQEGLVLRGAGEYRRSNQVLEWAEAAADDRYTRSLTRAAGSLLVSDRALLYTPSAGERVMLPYYRMLNYLDLGDVEGAKVEARRAAARVEREDGHPSARCAEEAVVLYVAAAVQRQGGEPGEADVTLRQARHLAAACPDAGLPADSAGADAPESDGLVLVVVEEGWVAHRTESAFHLALDPSEVAGLDGGSDAMDAAAARIAARLERDLAERAAWGESADDQPLVQWASALEGAYVLRLAWPRLVPGPRPAPSPRLLVDGGAGADLLRADLSAVAREDLDGERGALLARMVVRGLARYAATRALERDAEKRGGDAASFVVGRLANLAANRLEQADTRSWSLLPGRLSVARVRVPAGSHGLRLEEPGGRALELGEVSVAAGAVRVVTRRLWEGEDGRAWSAGSGSATSRSTESGTRSSGSAPAGSSGSRSSSR